MDEHPAGTITELGCGLNTRFERIDNGLAQWMDMICRTPMSCGVDSPPIILAAPLSQPILRIQTGWWNSKRGTDPSVLLPRE